MFKSRSRPGFWFWLWIIVKHGSTLRGKLMGRFLWNLCNRYYTLMRNLQLIWIQRNFKFTRNSNIWISLKFFGWHISSPMKIPLSFGRFWHYLDPDKCQLPRCKQWYLSYFFFWGNDRWVVEVCTLQSPFSRFVWFKHSPIVRNSYPLHNVKTCGLQSEKGFLRESPVKYFLC